MIFFFPDFEIPEKSDAFCFFNQVCENKLESCRKFWNLWEIIHYYSKLFTGVLNRGTRGVWHTPPLALLRPSLRLPAWHNAFLGYSVPNLGLGSQWWFGPKMNPNSKRLFEYDNCFWIEHHIGKFIYIWRLRRTFRGTDTFRSARYLPAHLDQRKSDKIQER